MRVCRSDTQLPWGAAWMAVASAALTLLPPGPAAFASRPAVQEQTRYSLANGCYGLRSKSSGRFVAKGGGGYRAATGGAGGAEPLRMQATRLGSYLLYGPARDFVSATARGGVAPAARPSPLADWDVSARAGAFTLSLPSRGKVLAVAGDGRLVLADARGAGDSARFTFEQGEGCAVYPEAEVGATGQPLRKRAAFGEVAGFLDAHVHLMFFEAIGGRFHCGRPWHPYGVAYALPDCAEIEGPRGAAAPAQNYVNFGSFVASHDTRGWPTFRDWPAPTMLSKESVYYKWLERAWRGGLRVLVALNTDNKLLCDVMPQRRYGCNEMAAVRRSITAVYALEDYVDAQSGGPGRGWFRVVVDPFEARRVINEGKLAVVLGIETSKLFDCGVFNDVPLCGRAQVDERLAEVHRLGVRQMELINKFDNAFAGVAGDEGAFGVFVNTGNKLDTGRFWDMRTCSGHAHDEPQALGVQREDIGLLVRALVPPGAVPVYPPRPHCNARGLTLLGEHLVRRMMERGMLIDPDHLGALARGHVLSVLAAARYGGVLSSHSWSDEESYPRIQRLGGVLAHHAGDSTAYLRQWRRHRAGWDERHYHGAAFGSDIHGISTQGRPRGDSPNAVRYPFRSFDGAVTLDRSRAGERVFDVNRDGVAHYGLYPDWIEDLRRLAGERVVSDLSRGAEAYPQVWGRAFGSPPRSCRPSRARPTRSALGAVRLGHGSQRLLRGAGQPIRRTRAWRYCVAGRRNRAAKVVAVFTTRGRVGLVGSTARGHRAGQVGRGAPARTLRGRTGRLGRGLLMRRIRGRARIVYGVRRGRVRYVAVASRAVGRTREGLRRYVAMAGLVR